MAKVNCADMLKAAFPDLNASELKAIRDELDNAKSRLFRPGTTDYSSADFRQKAMGLLNERRFQDLASRVERARNVLTAQKNLDFLTQDKFKGDPIRALQALALGQDVAITKGGSHSVGRESTSLAGGVLRPMIAQLEKISANEFMQKGLKDREVAQEMVKPGSTNSDMAKQIAKILNAANDATLRLKQGAGSMVRKLSDFVTHTIHDAEKLKAQGFDAWFDKMAGSEANHGKGYLNLERSFGVWDRAQIKEAMGEDFNRITRGVSDRLVPDGVSDTFIDQKGPSENLARKTARSRTYHFQDGYAFADYNSEFGSKNLMESVITDIQRSAKQAAMMRKFGTNPDAGWQAAKTRLAATLERSGSEAAAKTIRNSQELDRMYATTRGDSDGVGTGGGARTAQTLKVIKGTSSLGMIFPRALRDFAGGAARLNDINGKNLLSNVGDLMHQYASTFPDSAERAKIAENFSLGAEHLVGSALDRYGGTEAQPGMLHKMSETFYRAGQVPWHFENLKSAAAVLTGKALGEHASLPFAQLPARVQVTLSRYGITDAHWEGIRQGLQELKPGIQAISPSAVANVPEEAFGGKSQKFDAQARLGTLIQDIADSASNTHGDRQKWFMLRGTKDESIGVILRLISQFKLPMLQQVDNLRQFTMGDPGSQPQSMLEAVKSGSGMYRAAQFIALATALGYASDSITDLAQGKKPKDPTSLDTWHQAMLRGGSLGLYGDFLLGEGNRQESTMSRFARSAVGPVLSDSYTAMDKIFQPLMHGETKGVGKDAFDLAYQNMPFHNLWYAKAAFDQLIFNSIRESLSPGRAARTERATDKRQGYWTDYARPTHSIGVGP